MPEKKLRPPDNLPGLGPAFLAESVKLAREFSQPGTVKNFALRMGYMPHNEDDAEAILRRVIREGEWWEGEAERLQQELEWKQQELDEERAKNRDAPKSGGN